MRISRHMLGDEDPRVLGPPPPLDDSLPSPLLIGGLGAILITRKNPLLKLLGLAMGGWALLTFKSQSAAAAPMQDLVSVKF